MVIDPRSRELFQFREQMVGIEHHAVADDADDPRMQDAGGNLLEDELAVADDDGMSGVGAALVADDQVGPLREDVDELALALVAPLSADDHDASGSRVEHGRPPAGQQKNPRRGSGILTPN